MKTTNLETSNPDISLIEPNIERDAVLGVEWLNGKSGRATLTSMGVVDKDNKPTTLEFERQRVRSFIEREDQLNWMISYQGRVVGGLWVDLEQTGSVPAPGIHIMIGDPEVRGKGVGSAAMRRVIEYLQETRDDPTIYTRHLVLNSGAAKLLKPFGFEEIGDPYVDVDGLEFQNEIVRQKIS